MFGGGGANVWTAKIHDQPMPMPAAAVAAVAAAVLVIVCSLDRAFRATSPVTDGISAIASILVYNF